MNALHDAWQLLPDPLIELDAADCMCFVNSAACEMLNMPPAQILARPLSDILVLDLPVISPGEKEWSLSPLRRLFESGICELSGQLQTTPTALPVLLSIGRLPHTAGGAGLLLVLKDLGLLQEKNNRQREQDNLANQQQEMHLLSLGDLRLVHELSQPLSGIQLLAGQLQQTCAGKANDETAATLGFLIEQISALSAQVDRIREMALQQRWLQQEAVDLPDCLQEAMRFLEFELQAEGVEVLLDCPPGLPAVWSDRPRLVWCLVHLIHFLNQQPGCNRLVMQLRSAADRYVELLLGDPPAESQLPVIPALPAELQGVSVTLLRIGGAWSAGFDRDAGWHFVLKLPQAMTSERTQLQALIGVLHG